MELACLPARSAAALVASVALSGYGLSAQEVRTQDVDALARTVLQEVEVLRWYMGRPLEERDPIPIGGVTIRENFRQAMTLWQKVNQLGIELVGGGENPPVVQLPRGAPYGPEHVHVVLSGALARLEEIREGVGVVGSVGTLDAAAAPEFDPSATPSDVFRTIVQVNRQLNRMLERPVQPGDVYQQVQQAVFYSSEILTALDDANPFPAAPEYEPGLTPGHVYGRLLSVFDRMAIVFVELDLDMVEWRGEAYAVDEELAPGDVYDLATLLLSELEVLHGGVPGVRAPFQAAHPGHRWPSDVYQQAGVLLQQSARIMALARERPEAFRQASR